MKTGLNYLIHYGAVNGCVSERQRQHRSVILEGDTVLVSLGLGCACLAVLASYCEDRALVSEQPRHSVVIYCDYLHLTLEQSHYLGALGSLHPSEVHNELRMEG